MWWGMIGSSLSAGLGAGLIWFIGNANHKWKDGILALTAGVMLSAVVYGLLPEAQQQGPLWMLFVGVFGGVTVLHVLERKLPHADLVHTGAMDVKTKLVIMALVIHNIPEGLSVGMGYAEGTQALGGMVAFSIGLQNIPEGLLCALFLVRTMNRWKTVCVATLTGLVELIASLIGYALGSLFEGLLSLGLAFAGGAMLYLIFAELVPESHGDGHAKWSTYPFVGGVLLMMILMQVWS